MKEKIIYRQGDIILEPVESTPRTAKVVGTKLELRGETGHTHTLEATVLETPTQTYVQVKNNALMTHPQQPPLTVPPGSYAVRRLREYVENRRSRAVFD